MEPARQRITLSRFVWILCVWVGFGIFNATQNLAMWRHQGLQVAWLQASIVIIVMWLPWAIATPLILRLAEKLSNPSKRLTTLFEHVILFLGISVVFIAWMAWFDVRFTPQLVRGSFVSHLYESVDMNILFCLLLYCCVGAAGYLNMYRERLTRQEMETAKLNEQLSKAQLNALRRQFEPHFLFNTLNAAVGLIRERRDEAAVSTLVLLSDLLHRVLKDSRRQSVTLEEEMEFLQKYLQIQKIRFADRLQLSLDIPSSLHSAQFPTFVLQPIVENAIKHGIAKREQGGTIEISAVRSNGSLTLNVCNDGPPLLSPPHQGEEGMGMSNIRTRLETLYGDTFALTMQNRDSAGVRVSVSIPFSQG